MNQSLLSLILNGLLINEQLNQHGMAAVLRFFWKVNEVSLSF